MNIYRVQDVEGRGPSRPGFSEKWTDPDGPVCPPWWVETGECMEAAIKRLENYDLYLGCGFSTLDQFHQWFTSKELRRLQKFGYRMVTIEPDKVFAITPRQVVFGTVEPLSSAFPRISLVSKLVKAA